MPFSMQDEGHASIHVNRQAFEWVGIDFLVASID